MPTAPTSTSSADPLMDTQLFWARNKTAIIAGLLILILALAGYGAFRYQSARREAAAATLLAEAKVPANYEKLIAQYPKANATASGYLLLATEQRKADKFAEANGTLQKFLDQFPRHQLVTTAKMAMAANFESQGKRDEAIETYRRLAAEHPKDFNAPLALIAQAHLLRFKGQADEARRVCETVMTQYRDSLASAEATRILRILKPAAAPAATAAAADAPPASSAPPVQTSPASPTPPTP